VTSLLGALFRESRLVAELVRRDIRSRYAGARFGLLWSILNPAIQLGSYSLIFGFFYGRSAPEAPSRIVALLFCGLWPWWSFQDGTMRGLSALVDQGELLRRVPLAPEACIAASVTAAVLLQSVGFALFLASFAAIGLIEPRLAWIALPGVMVLGLALTMGLAMVLAPLFAAVRDTAHIVSALLTVGFFASPVLYDLEALPSGLRSLAILNPMATLIGLYRASVMAAPRPEVPSLAVLLCFIVCTWLVASRLLARTRGRLDEYW
jgi:ABC-type polysaccharide/polyol phosphate export permease